MPRLSDDDRLTVSDPDVCWFCAIIVVSVLGYVFYTLISLFWR